MCNDDEKNERDSDQYKELKEKIKTHELYQYRYIINWTKREFVAVPKFKKDTWTVHPLPILTADGVGRGGGDYHTDYPDGTEKE